MDRDGFVEPGFAMDSAWRGALPPESGFVHLDDVPARVMLDLAQRGVALAKEHSSAHGPPASLLDQEVVAVSAGDASVGIPMRCVFALTAMGFLPPVVADAVAADEIVRVRVLPAWLRIDARFGSVYRRRGDPAVYCASLELVSSRELACGVGTDVSAETAVTIECATSRLSPAPREGPHAASRKLDQPGGGVRRQLAVGQLRACQQQFTIGQRHRATCPR